VQPLLSVITSISFDHMGLLGRTIGRIAGEKAGIIKRGRPVVCGARQPSARQVIAATAHRRRARLVQLGVDFTARYQPPTGADPLAPGSVVVTPLGGAACTYRLGMAGRHQAENAALAVMAAAELAAAGWPVDEGSIARGLARASLPARIEVLAKRPLVVVDAAHNVASMESLLETVGPALADRRPRVLLFAASRDKQIEEMLAVVRGGFEQIVVTRYLTNPRAAPIDRLVAACRTARLPAPHVAGSPPEALRLARRLAGPSGSVVVAGSFFLAGELGR
jgi:dihydrofolate synthase/folylpolyglutamate synthase